MNPATAPNGVEHRGAVHLRYAVTALSRISAGRSAEVGNSRSVHEVIPGATVRGALAAAWLGGDAPDGATRSAFRDLFEGALVVRQAVPVGMGLEAVSGRRCKYPDPASSRPWHDLARDYADGRPPTTRCPDKDCGGALEPGRGWAWHGRPTTVATTRTALDSSEVARDEQLFTRRALTSDTILRGSLVVLDPAQHAAALDWLTGEREIRVGGQRSHMGRAAWTCARISNPSSPDVTGRVVLRARSPLILADDFGAPTTDPSDTLRRRWPAAVVLKAWTRPVRVTGWHAASGIPKPEDWACEAGSTFFVEGLPPDAAHVLVLGLGLRRLEGFGEVEVLRVEELPTFDDPRSDAGGPEAQFDPPGPARPDSSRAVDQVGELVELLPPESLATLLPKVAAGVRWIELGRPPYGSGDDHDARVASILRLPWATELGSQARERLRDLLDVEDVAATKMRIDALKERHR